MANSVMAVPHVSLGAELLLPFILLGLESFLGFLSVLVVPASFVGQLFLGVVDRRLTVLRHGQIAVRFFEKHLLEHALPRRHVISIDLKVDLLAWRVGYVLKLNFDLPHRPVVRRLLV